MPGQNLTAARSLLKLAVHSASSAPTINVQKVSTLLSAFAFVAHFDKNAVKVQALIRKEFERNKNETRPEVVEVCLLTTPIVPFKFSLVSARASKATPLLR